MKKVLKRVLLIAGGLILAAGVGFLIWTAVRWFDIQKAHTPEVEYDPNVWFELRPEGAIDSTGAPLTTRMRVGSVNKVIVIFYGGGISLNEYTAARPYTGQWIDREPGFYSADSSDQIPSYCELGVASRQPDNPFRDWTVVVIPYATADFHIGDGTFDYTSLSGEERTLYHHGYGNFHAIMDEAVRYTGDAPEELLITGWSAGGYGAVMLADELMERYFPAAGHTTVCVDSSLLILDDWAAVADEVWGAPETFTSRMESVNLVVDFMGALYEKYGDEVTYLYVGSVRDGALAKYQAYFDTGRYYANNASAWVYTGYLRMMIALLRVKVPTVGIFLFDRLPYSPNPFMSFLTQHTIVSTQTAYWPLHGRQSAIGWLDDAVRGDVRSYGLELLRTR